VDDADRVDPPADLLAVSTQVVPVWLRRVAVTAARAGGIDPAGVDDQIEAIVRSEADQLLSRLRVLLSADVDQQRTNPLSLFRDATSGITAMLSGLGVAPAGRDRFALERFPDDHYGLVPATWSDIDPALQEPGIAWGAWKAMTVLQRRRHGG
jgi:hypothetical protein